MDTVNKKTASEETDEEDVDSDYLEDDMLTLPSFLLLQKARHSVSAEVYGEWNKRKPFVAPVYEKTPEQAIRILSVLNNCFMFQNLEEDELQTVLLAFTEVYLSDGEVLIKQGEDGDSLYLIESGCVDVFKLSPGETEPKHMCVMKAGDAVGELALLYNTPRAATVIGKGDVILWKLDRESFNEIVKESAMKKREMHENFLREVEILKDMDPYERSKLSDGLKTMSFETGSTIIKQGDIGDRFYIIESGNAAAEKDGEIVMNYSRGDYFGELALIRNQPRAATIRAKDGPVKCVTLDRRSFQRLLGPVEDILKRNAARYEQVQSSLKSTNV